jgi:rhomboid protease GluP
LKNTGDKMYINALKNPRAIYTTYLILALNLAVYAYTAILSGNFMVISLNVLLQYGQSNYLVINGLYWQLFTAIFVHTNIVHLTGNMLFLIIFGLRAEELFNMMEYFFIYLLSGLAGNLLTLLLGLTVVSAGASGAIFGLFGACAIYVRRKVGQSLVGALVYTFFLLIVTGTSPYVNVLAHFGGLATGLIIGYGLASKSRA